MKTIIVQLILAFSLLLNFISIGQTPEAFKYQAVVRNGSGDIVPNQEVNFRFSIHNGNESGPVVYSEVQMALTNQFGLAVLNIGSGTPVSGVFSAIDWGTGSKFLEVEMDPAGGGAYVSMGTSQLLSVPYAMYSENTANADDADADPANELQSLSITGNELSISDGNSVTLPGSGAANRITDNDGNTWVDAELNSNNDSIVFTTMGMNRMTIRPNGYINVNGQLVATGFQGDGSGLTGVPGDNLGDHTATEELDMSNHRITNVVSPMNANDAATKLYVDTQISLSGDNLGDHHATQNLAMNGNRISNDGDNEGISINNDGNVGINTALPDQRLTVDGNIRSQGKIMADYGSNVEPTFMFGTGTENSGLASPHVNSVAVITNGAERLTVRQSGNVGIGEPNPQAPLHIFGHIRMEDGNQGPGKVLTSDAVGNSRWADPISGDSGWQISGDNMYSVPTGNVGIGTTTPGATLEVGGRISQSGLGNSVFLGKGAGYHDDLSNNQNVAIGDSALFNNAYGNANIAIGAVSLYANNFGTHNIALGSYALHNNTSGQANIATGVNSLTANLTGDNNAAYGTWALFRNTSGNNNTANGYGALWSNTTGNSNVAIGTNSLYNSENRSNLVAIGDSALFRNGIGASESYHSTGNTAIGSKALFTNSTGYYNTSVGAGSLYSNDIGFYNTAVGCEALYWNISGDANVALGEKSLYRNTTGNGNIAIGESALYGNESGNTNIAVGSGVLNSNTYGHGNISFGFHSLSNNSTGYYNIVSGNYALYENTIGSSNIAFGNYSLRSNTSGNNNISIGNYSLFDNNDGYSNVAIGAKALLSSVDRSNLVAIGDSALCNNGLGTTIPYQATRNTALGSKALYANNIGDENTASGFESLYSNEGGYFNSAFGCQASYQNVSGSRNTAIGNNALYDNVSGSNNTALGYNAYNSSGNYSNSTAIGFSTAITASNQVRLGNSSVTSIGGYANWTNLSDERFKKNVNNNVPGLDFILKLEPVTYQMDVEKLDKFLGIEKGDRDDGNFNENAKREKENIIQTGFIAQDVERTAIELGFDFSGIDKPDNENDHYGLRYAEFVVPLVKAVQEQQAIIDSQSKKIDMLQNELETIKSTIK